VVDVGTGAGFPGLPLKIVLPRIRLTLVEATGKKADFCRHMVEVLGLDRVEVIHARAEEIGHRPEHREAYDWALARAVAVLPVLVEYLLPLLRIGGRAIAQKGEAGPAEAQAAEPALRLVGGRIRQVIPVELPGVAEPRFLVVMEKAARTPEGYPRRAGVPAKKPLG
jgi:16S rRNA (guanine527-N7)-methyltransferase